MCSLHNSQATAVSGTILVPFGYHFWYHFCIILVYFPYYFGLFSVLFWFIFRTILVHFPYTCIFIYVDTVNARAFDFLLFFVPRGPLLVFWILTTRGLRADYAPTTRECGGSPPFRSLCLVPPTHILSVCKLWLELWKTYKDKLSKTQEDHTKKATTWLAKLQDMIQKTKETTAHDNQTIFTTTFPYFQRGLFLSTPHSAPWGATTRGLRVTAKPTKCGQDLSLPTIEFELQPDGCSAVAVSLRLSC